MYDPLQNGVQNRLYASADYLFWWTKGDHLPPLVTTSVPETTQTPIGNAGVLGLSTTRVLFGGDEVNDGYRSGVRINLGTWLDPCRQAGIEVSFVSLGNNDQSANFNSTTTPILGVPLTNVLTGNQVAILAGYPNVATGTIGVTAANSFDTLEVLLRRSVYQNCNSGTDFLLGYRYARLADTISMNDSVTGTGEGGIVPVGTTLNVADRFNTTNTFNGLEIGFDSQIRRCAWSVDLLMKLALGSTHTGTTINGSTTRIPPAGGAVTTSDAGLFALSSNIGNYNGNQFSVMPELGLTVGYDVTSRLRATMGYTFIYWSQVLRAGEQIDTNINPNLFPPPTTAPGVRQPQFLNSTSDFWAQGLSWGLEYTF
jgi:hypothetical protein